MIELKPPKNKASAQKGKMMQDKMKSNIIWYDEIRFKIKINMKLKHTIHIDKHCNLMGKSIIDPS